MVRNIYLRPSIEKIERILVMFASFLTPTIGILTVFIAYQQWKTNEIKRKQDLYDRRFAVYLSLAEFMQKVSNTGKVSEKDLVNLGIASEHAYFLFGPEIVEYIELVCDQGFEISNLTEARKNSLRPEHERVQMSVKYSAQEYGDLFDWFHGQYEVARQKFDKYLSIKT